MGSIGNSVISNSNWTNNADILDGKPGTYNLFRSGNLWAPNGMIFLATNPKEAEYYGEVNRDLDAYTLDVNNPLVINAETDVQAVQLAWKALHPDKELKLGPNGLVGNKWQQLDKQNSTALAKSEYDALMYRVDGKLKEVQIPGKQRERLIKKDTREHLGTTTYKYSLEKARNIVHDFNGSEEQLASKIVSAVSNSKYTAEYIPWMNTVSVSLKNGSSLEKDRSTVYYKLRQSANGKWFITQSR